MACKSTKFTGRDCVLEYAIGCGDTMPQAGDWKRVSAMRSKELTIEWETSDSTTDDVIGALRSNHAQFQTASISGDGLCMASGTGAQNLIDLTKHIISPSSTSGQPTAWLRLTFKDLTYTFFALLTNASRSAPYDDMVSYSLEATATSSDFGLIIADTPDPSAAAPTAVAVFPTTASVQVGKKAQLAAIVSPFNAPSGVVWSSATPATATVNQSGVVTGVATGTVIITAKSAADNSKLATSTITVTA